MSNDFGPTDAATRERMQKVRVRDTSIERLVRSILHRRGYRFTLRRRDLPGKPDVVLPKYSTVIFVHGCFWHGHDACRKGTIRPKRNAALWEEKIRRNVSRDAAISQQLVSMGWQVVTIWECEVKDQEALGRSLEEMLTTALIS
jgi:DNA mismatch endonuclease (patch repair protein)